MSINRAPAFSDGFRQPEKPEYHMIAGVFDYLLKDRADMV